MKRFLAYAGAISIFSTLFDQGFAVEATIDTGKADSMATCTPTSRISKFTPQNINVLRGDGILGSEIKGLSFNLIESMHQDCKITTSYVLDYTIYNHWQDGGGAGAAIYISLRSGETSIKQNAVVFGVPLGFCGPYGTPGKAIHMEGALNDNYIDITDNFLISASRISGRIGQC